MSTYQYDGSQTAQDDATPLPPPIPSNGVPTAEDLQNLADHDTLCRMDDPIYNSAMSSKRRRSYREKRPKPEVVDEETRKATHVCLFRGLTERFMTLIISLAVARYRASPERVYK